MTSVLKNIADDTLVRQNEAVIADLGFDVEMTRLRSEIERWIVHCDDEMREALEWQFLGPSKYFRPITVFCCCRAVNGTRLSEDAIRSAFVVELFHNVSLIIDDIVDHSRHRRGKLTLHCRFGTLRALMTAGYIVAEGYHRSQNDAQAVKLLSELLQRLGVAECLQWRLRQQPLGVEDWRRIAGEDTGSMFEVCAVLGARDERLRRFGHLLGMLYHGCDDVADVKGLAALGGGGQEDLRDGILTLPAALAIRDPAVAAMFRDSAAADLGRLAEAFELKLPEAEHYLDRIAAEAREEARHCAADPTPLFALVDQTRELSSR